MKKKKTISRILAVLFAAVMAACFVPQTGALVYADETEHVHNGVTFQHWNDPERLPFEPGNYYLTTDVTLSDGWGPGGEISLCLNGHSITSSIQREYVATNEHPVEAYRANIPLENYDEFIDFYHIKEGDGMYLAPEDRITVW